MLISTLIAAAFLSGCVERRLTINTEPQGAIISLNDEEIGASPVTVGFNWYGNYKVRATRPGYEILDTNRKLDPPAHDGFPLDFFATIWPSRITDEYEWTFQLTPYKTPDRDQLIRDAQALKKQVNQPLLETEEEK
jgi:hypothetical protein